MKRGPTKGHPGITFRTWTSSGKTQRRYDASYRDSAGKKHSQTFRKLSAAEAWLRHEQDDVASGRWIDPRKGKIRFEVFYEGWMAKARAKGKPRERTLIEYSAIWRQYIAPGLGGRQLARITQADIDDVLAVAADVSSWRHNDVLKVTRLLLAAAVRGGHISRNPAAGIEAVHVDQEEPWVLNAEEVDRLADVMPARYKALVLLAAYGSLRWSELIALTIADLDLMRNRVRVDHTLVEAGTLIIGEPKTKRSRRWVTVPEDVKYVVSEHIRKYLPPTSGGLIFTAERGGAIRRPAFGRLVWRPATTRAGLAGFPFRNLRHTGAVMALEAGVSPVLVAFRMGHTTTRMIETTYGRLLESMDAEIASRISGNYRAGRSESTAIVDNG
jgi:integrase